jgi:NIPSNAP
MASAPRAIEEAASKETTMITCFIRYEIEPGSDAAFATYGRGWGEAIPRCGADLIGYFGPHEGSATTAYGVYSIASLAAYEAYRARLREDPTARDNFDFARRERFIRREDRLFLRPVSGPLVPVSR